MLAHRLRHRVRVEEFATIQNPNTGAITEAWRVVTLSGGTALSDVPAEVLTGAGRELNASGSVQAEVSARINMRWFPGLTQAMRIVWDGVIYNIGSIEMDATARQEYRLRCTGGVNAG